MMNIEQDPENVVNDGDAEFDAAFSEFASGKKPDPDPEGKAEEEAPSEGNAPEEKEGGEQPPEPSSETGTSEDKPAGGEQPPAEQAPDLWASAPPELKAQWEQTQRDLEAARHAASSDRNRVAALSRKLAALTAGGAQALPDSSKAEPDPVDEALKAKIEQVKTDFPDLAAPILELIEQQRNELKTVRGQVGEISARDEEARLATEMQALDAKHPDWRQVAVDPRFAGWAEQQPETIQRLATSWDAREVSVALTLYKTETGAAATTPVAPAPPEKEEQKPGAATGVRRSQQLEGGADVGSKPAPAASGPPEDFDAAFAFFVEKQQRERAAQKR